MRVFLAVELLQEWLGLATAQIGADGTLTVALAVLTSIVGMIGIVGEVAKLQYLRRLATRIPNDAMARRARFLGWGAGIAAGLVLLSITLLYLAALRSPGAAPGGATYTVRIHPAPAAPVAFTSPMLMGLSCLVGVAGACLFVFWILTIRLLIGMRRAFCGEAANAQAIWSKGVVGEARPVVVDACLPTARRT